MGRITKLELQGFKSFAKKTVILFPSNFSVIAGPNGSGKSNTLDAIVFVLGRRSAKSMRAEKSTELIFNGARKSGPAEFAKVSITFDNSDKKFPLEDNDVSVTRQINRRGVSIYKLNNETVTREKVLEVLRASHIHSDGHNIILQGDITEIIEMNPIERRKIIDEVAGISEFEEKREKAFRELDIVEGRVKESSIILNEREILLKKLAAEKESAEHYNKLANDLDRLRFSLAKKRLAEAEEAMGSLEKKMTDKETDSSLAEGELTKIDKEFEGLEQSLKRVTQKLMDRGKDIAVIKELEKMRSDIFSKKAKADSNEFEIARIDDLIKKLEQIRAHQMEGNAVVQAVMKLGRAGIYGTIGSLSKIPSQYQSAIEVAAGNHLFDVVVDSTQTAVECVNYLKSNRIGRATFLPLDKIRERDGKYLKKFIGKPGVVGVAIDLISFQQKYWHAFSHIFGDTLIVDKVETARNLGIGEARYVTLEGDLIERSGAIIGGFYRQEKRNLYEFEDAVKYEEQKKKLQKEVEELRKEVREMTDKLQKLMSEEQKGGEDIQKFNAERNESEAALDNLRRKRKEFYDNKVIAADEVNKLKINRARMEAELENLKAEFEQTNKNVELLDLSLTALQNKIRENISKIAALGPINQRAVEEYKTLEVEYRELKSKVDTLTAERNRVIEIITDIEGRRRTTFMKTLDEISKQFKIIFKDLLKGEGDLRLEGEILEEAGLVIEASPPGRKVLNIDAMSGGEKTMTALAFLFAIQTFRPAPFYILDEIDAALDKPNTKKMNEFIQLNSKKAQFIVISHNDTTISAADCVYGVSMEDGESKLIGIKMPE